VIVPTYVPGFLSAGTGTVNVGLQVTTWLPRIEVAISTISTVAIERRVAEMTVAVPNEIKCEPEAYLNVLAVKVSVRETKLEATAFVVHEPAPVLRRVSVTVIVSRLSTASVETEGVTIEVNVSLVGTEIDNPPEVKGLMTNCKLVTSARAIDVAGKTITNVAT
jgi:hypothetical protein